jgi:hypothetical protein
LSGLCDTLTGVSVSIDLVKTVIGAGAVALVFLGYVP